MEEVMLVMKDLLVIILVTVVPILARSISVYFAAQTANANNSILRSNAEATVAHVEQIAVNKEKEASAVGDKSVLLTSEDKYQMAKAHLEAFLKERKINLTEEQIKTAIESAVYKLT